MKQILIFGASVFLLMAASITLAGETLYVQPAQTPLKSAPQMNAANITQLRRGEALTVLKKEGIWFQVTAGKSTGWISKLFVNTSKPVGEAELSKELADDKNLGKASRRRVSSYAASASTRGLTAGNRMREGRETYQSDFKAVEKMEELKVPENELRNFQQAGKLGQ
ncbi:MAG: SH3 domain-containing protein [Oligoflexia bacterium]|nr:SH3 domain-containing protein [Oligoflexia bacterium]